LTDDGGVLAAVEHLTAAALGDKTLTYKNTGTAESSVRAGLTDTIDALSKRIARAAEGTVRLMADFRNKYPNETTDIDAALEAAGDYNRLLEQLVSNDLPRFEDIFKESLNQNTIHEVVAFNAFLDSRRQDIVNRIGEINQSLAGIEYNPGRHIQLEHQNTSDQDVREFGVDLRACSEGTIGDEDQYSEQKYLQVERLIERFRGREGLTTLDERWTAKVTDVRNWFTFSASEKWTETGEEFEHFTDSGGKSGGQKEKLAYTILAAALAFQFGLGSGAGCGLRRGRKEVRPQFPVRGDRRGVRPRVRRVRAVRAAAVPADEAAAADRHAAAEDPRDRAVRLARGVRGEHQRRRLAAAQHDHPGVPRRTGPACRLSPVLDHGCGAAGAVAEGVEQRCAAAGAAGTVGRVSAPPCTETSDGGVPAERIRCGPAVGG
jgi:hypothetical protein